MKKKQQQKSDDKEQSQRFVETAKQLEADKNTEAFEAAFSSIIPIEKKVAHGAKEEK